MNSDDVKEGEWLIDQLDLPVFVAGTHVKQSHALTRAVYALNIYGKRVIWLCLSEVARRRNEKEHNGIFRLTAKAYREAFGGSYTHSARDLKAGITSLKTDGGVTFRSDLKGYHNMWLPWLAKEHNAFEGTPKAEHLLCFTPEVFNVMIGRTKLDGGVWELDEYFTLFALNEVSRLVNPIHARLYEFCHQWRENGGVKVKKDDLLDLMSVGKHARNNAAALRTRVLNPAKKRIEAASSLRIDYAPDGEYYVFTIIDTAKIEKANTDGLPVEPEETEEPTA